jgi:CRP-like cAMP-binding protein
VNHVNAESGREEPGLVYNRAILLPKQIAHSNLYPAGVELYSQRSSCAEVYVVVEGIVKLAHVDSSGREMIVGLRFPGWVLGASSAIIGKLSPTAAITLTRCTLQHVPAEVFCGLVRRDEGLSWKLHQMHSREVFDHIGQLVGIGCLSARVRLEYLLRQLIGTTGVVQKKIGREVWLLLPMKQRELAHMIAVSPEHLSRLFKEMRQEGLIRFRKGWIIVPDLSVLKNTDDLAQ